MNKLQLWTFRANFWLTHANKREVEEGINICCLNDSKEDRPYISWLNSKLRLQNMYHKQHSIKSIHSTQTLLQNRIVRYLFHHWNLVHKHTFSLFWEHLILISSFQKCLPLKLNVMSSTVCTLIRSRRKSVCGASTKLLQKLKLLQVPPTITALVFTVSRRRKKNVRPFVRCFRPWNLVTKFPMLVCRKRNISTNIPLCVSTQVPLGDIYFFFDSFLSGYAHQPKEMQNLFNDSSPALAVAASAVFSSVRDLIKCVSKGFCRDCDWKCDGELMLIENQCKVAGTKQDWRQERYLPQLVSCGRQMTKKVFRKRHTCLFHR